MNGPIRRTFVLGAGLIVAVLAAVVALRLPGAIITVAALGMPLLFVIGCLRAGVLQRLPRGPVALVVVLAIGLAVGWVLLTGDAITTMAESAFGAGTVGRRVLRDGFGIAEGGTLLMLVPVAVVRLLWRSSRNPMDGVVIGALATLLFTGTATLTRLAPQFVADPVARNQLAQGIFFEAAIRGVAVPVTAACAGGLIGGALWSDRVRRSAALTMLAAGIAVLAVYAVMGWADVEGASQLAILGWHLAMAVFALIAMSVGLRLARPRRGTLDGRSATVSALPVLATWLAVTAAVSVLLIAVPALITKPDPRYNCPPDCGSPPTGRPFSANPRFTAPDGSYSVAYPEPGSVYDVTIDDTGIRAKLLIGDGGTLRLTSEPAGGRTAQDVAHTFVTKRFPSAATAFEIPNAMVGFEPGYGEVANVFPSGLNTGTRLRVVIVVAIKNGLALIAGAIGPFHEFGPSFGPGRPSPTSLQIAEDMGRYVNSFRWRGDPPG